MGNPATGQPPAGSPTGRPSRRGVLLVVAGPSGVGKGTIIAGVRERHPAVRLSISCTTRPPRPGEEDGRDYFFVTPEEFDRLRDAGDLLEWAVVHGDHRYGTPRGPVEDALAKGEDILLEIDYQGAESVRRALGDRAVLVFVAPPSWRALLDRLDRRHTEDPVALARRLASARREFQHMELFDYMLVNDELEQAVAELEAILIAERLRLVRVDWQGLQARLLAEADERGGGDGHA